ncbi:protein containing 3-phosphoshikimate 1-carboxyvinyltransferase, subgroup domain protein [gut metagenome]|uniref:3-phosphoshikimate 1-carboxyvinyltransferase n=1 Tax=gut metagenome TaxID=749906 RepID=J9D933_9ZZZZ
MQYQLTAPKRLCVTIVLPASKSISNRALIIHGLSHGNFVPQNLSDCDDTRVMIRAFREWPETIDILAAGTAMRFLTAYLSVSPGTHLITGTQRMQQRPIRILVDALRALGAEITYVGEEGFPPLRITGTALHGSEITLPGHVSSQYISALLMIGPTLPHGLRLHLTGELISRPYIQLTLALMQHYGATARWENDHTLNVEPGGYQDRPFWVESDWSGASYWYQLMALHSLKRTDKDAAIELLGLFPNSCQGDSRVAKLFARLGVHTEYTDRGILLTPIPVSADKLEEDFTDIPDLAQTFVVTCCLMDIPFRFTGLQSLKIKETDRITALITELCKIGYVIHSEKDSILYWSGERCEVKSIPIIETYEDHRMAMAFAPVAIKQSGLRINHPEVVSKSYPRFWTDLKQAGFLIHEII